MPKSGFWRGLFHAAGSGARQGLDAYVRSGGKASAGLSEVLNQGGTQQRLSRREKQQLAQQLRLGHAMLRMTNSQPIRRWSKYSSSTDSASGRPQTDYYEGYVGETNRRFKVHIAVDENGSLLFVRDIDGTVIFDRSRGDTPPHGWE